MLTTKERMLRDIAQFCKRLRMADSAFGRAVANDSKLLPDLRNGRDPTLSTIEAIYAYIALHTPKKRKK